MAIHDVERLDPTPSIEGAQNSESTSLLLSHSKKIDYHSTSTDALSRKSSLTSTDDDTNQIENEEGDASPKKSQSPIGIISLLLIGVFIANADNMLVLATYGTIASEFHAVKDAAWLTTSFSLASCALQPLMGKLSDILGRKSVLLVSYGLFTVGCVICGISQSMPQIILGRVVTGLGSAGMTVLVSILITDLVPLLEVASWRSFVNVIATLGRSIGGPLGGLLSDTVGWRWSFTGQGPLLLLAIIPIAFRLPKFDCKEEELRKGQPSRLRRIDFVGAGLLSSCIVTLLGALSLAGSLAWGHPIVLGLLGGSIVIGAFFVIWEEKYAFEAIFPPSLVARRDVATSYLIQGLQICAQVAMMFSVPLYFRSTQGSSNTEAGTHLFPAVLGNTAGALLAGYIIQRTGRYRLLTIIASIFSSASYLLLILRWHGHVGWLESLYIVPGGFGTGIVFSSSMISSVASVRKDEIAIATGGLYLAGNIGMMVGVSASSSVQLSTLRVLLEKALGEVAGGREIIERAISDVGSIKGMEEGLREVVVGCYVKSLEYSHMVSLGSTILALILACTIREHPLK